MYPDFLGIGAQKSGTTWLHANLSQHPQIWMPPVKEIHYLDGRWMSLSRRLLSDTKRARKARSYLVEQVRALPSGGRLNDLRWALRYLLPPRSDAWYQSLFPDIPGVTTGEICPGYAKLRGEAVGRVHLLMPDAKVIYIIRNPIERSWSYAAQYFTSPRWKIRYGSLDRVSEHDLKKFLEKDRSGHSDYLGALTAWQAYYGEGQMLVAFFDELVGDPKSLLKRILDFLGIDSSENVIPATVGKNRNPSRGSGAPPELQAYLASLHMDQLAELHARFDNSWTSAWLDSAREAIAADSSAASNRSFSA